MRYFLFILVALTAHNLAYAQIISNKKSSATTTPAANRPAETPAAFQQYDAAKPAAAGAATAVACPAGEVKIGNVTWAGSNVSSLHTFAPRLDSLGMLYQFNNAVPYTSSNPVKPDWKADSTGVNADWGALKDPCPNGWRLPTNIELQALVEAGSAWYTGYSVPGRFYGPNAAKASRNNTSGCVFFPAAGLRNDGKGWLFNQKSYGYYWSSKQYSGSSIYLYLHNSGSGVSSGSKNFAYSVRCVKK